MKNLLLILAVIALLVLPLLLVQNGAFGGTDDKAVVMIQSINGSYKPWFGGVKLFESPEIISTCFAIQAALGAGFLGYYMGYVRGRKSGNNRKREMLEIGNRGNREIKEIGK